MARRPIVRVLSLMLVGAAEQRSDPGRGVRSCDLRLQRTEHPQARQTSGRNGALLEECQRGRFVLGRLIVRQCGDQLSEISVHRRLPFNLPFKETTSSATLWSTSASVSTCFGELSDNQCINTPE